MAWTALGGYALALPHLYLAALAAGLVVVPCYCLTASIAADGFNHQAGLRYAWQALTANLHTLLRNLGYAGAPLALIAIVVESGSAGRRRRAGRWSASPSAWCWRS
ncbi:hypothetical protein [Duganella sp. CF517]|uniref:hypothetical protein n=1 Tax=Duganella sp. CF517 TaxID=1881038 RepID=UPI000B7E60A8|nr:hypothetical protein [Duganella sp. CF517]